MEPIVVDEPSLEGLRRTLHDLDRVVVAFSGGADSAFLARMAHDTLGSDRVHVVTAVSPSLAGDERAEAASLADEWGLRWSEVETHEMVDAAYRVNDADRCGRCKDALMDVLDPIAYRAAATVVLGGHVDDLGDHRPGLVVASEWTAERCAGKECSSWGSACDQEKRTHNCSNSTTSLTSPRRPPRPPCSPPRQNRKIAIRHSPK